MDEYFHEAAKAAKPKEDLNPTRFWVGILLHDKEFRQKYEETHFLWMKANKVSI